jgi:glycerol-3-phosphate dehydrogenase (NAD(P)+)
MSEHYEIAVLGAGAWGTALAVLHASQDRRVCLWARSAEHAGLMREQRENKRLPGVRLPGNLAIAHHFPSADLLLFAVPVQFARAVLRALPEAAVPLVLCCKGLEASTLALPSELATELHPEMEIAVLTGPNFAHEIAAGLPAASVIAAADAGLRQRLMTALHTPTLRLYGSADVVGAALGGAAKNVVAIASGAVMGAGLGENARAALITRGIAEIARLAVALGGRPETVSGLSGLGDLLLTCTGTSSRNFSLGFDLGRDIPLARILTDRRGVAEGVATTPALLARASEVGVDLPIAQVVGDLLEGRLDVAGSLATLMQRQMRDE